MKTKTRFRKAQSFLEYSFVITVIVGSLLAMQSYVSRALQGKLKESVDSIGGDSFPAGVRSPGQGFSSQDTTTAVKTKSFVFTYEGEKGYSVSAGRSSRSELTKVEAMTLPEITTDVTYEGTGSLLEADIVDIAEKAEDSALDPKIAALEEKIAEEKDFDEKDMVSETTNDSEGTYQTTDPLDGSDDTDVQSLDTDAEDAYDRYKVADPTDPQIDRQKEDRYDVDIPKVDLDNGSYTY